MKPEREDLLVEEKDFASNVALQTVLAAVGASKHKVYALGWECDTDGTYHFSGTFGGNAKKFCRRITKGVYAQTFVQPVVLDTNTALQFMSNGGASKVWVQYITE